MSYKDKLSKEDVENIFTYNPMDGKLYRKSTGNEVRIDPEADAIKVRFTTEDGSRYWVHYNQIVWLLANGSWPQDILFHRDFNKCNMKITNLMTVDRIRHATLVSAYNNLTKYCDVKQHHKYVDVFLVRYLSNKKLKHERYSDYGFAKAGAERLKETYRRLIVKLGGIPPN